MTFLSPELLWFLLALPALVAAYIFLLRSQKLPTLRLSNLAIVREAVARHDYRRHVPASLLFVSIATLIIAAARPSAVVLLPGREDTVILAMDVSASMLATDVEPSRLSAAQRATREFVANMPRDVRIGIVSFAAAAAIVQGPTLDREAIDGAINRLSVSPSTNLYSGLALSLAAMFPDNGIESEHFTPARPAGSVPGKPIHEQADKEPVAPGSFRAGAIVLLSDGQRTLGRDPLDAARMAAVRGVKVYTVGLGTPEGSIISFRGWNVRVRLDEETLKEISRMTDGRYFNATSAEDLRAVYEGLSNRVIAQKQNTELTALFALAAAALIALGAGLSLVWFGGWS